RSAPARSGFVRVAPFLGVIVPPEPRLEREPRQALGRVLFPRGAIEEARSAHTRDLELTRGHHHRIIPDPASAGLDIDFILPYTSKYENACSSSPVAPRGLAGARPGLQGPRSPEPAGGLLHPGPGQARDVGGGDPGGGRDSGTDPLPPPRPAAPRGPGGDAQESA